MATLGDAMNTPNRSEILSNLNAARAAVDAAHAEANALYLKAARMPTGAPGKAEAHADHFAAYDRWRETAIAYKAAHAAARAAGVI